jgi:hypothetical protein
MTRWGCGEIPFSCCLFGCKVPSMIVQKHVPIGISGGQLGYAYLVPLPDHQNLRLLRREVFHHSLQRTMVRTLPTAISERAQGVPTQRAFCTVLLASCYQEEIHQQFSASRGPGGRFLGALRVGCIDVPHILHIPFRPQRAAAGKNSAICRGPILVPRNCRAHR